MTPLSEISPNRTEKRGQICLFGQPGS
jgi:hypothetical protein